MMANLFSGQARLSRKQLTELANSDSSQQLALLNELESRYADGIPENITEDLQEAMSALLDRWASMPQLSNVELTAASKACRLSTDLTLIQRLLDQPNLVLTAAERLEKIADAATVNRLQADRRVIDARIEHAKPNEIDALLARVTCTEQMAMLAVRAPHEKRQELLTLPLLKNESGIVLLEKF